MKAGAVFDVRPEKFVFIPATGSHVYISKANGYDVQNIIYQNGYDGIRMAQRLCLNPTSSAEWCKSRKYFQDMSEVEFSGRTGCAIKYDYETGDAERTSTLLAFRSGSGDFPKDVQDLLKKAGFDGKVALIDFPYVQEDSDIFIPSPRTRIVDVSGRLPSEDGYIQDYDEDLGIPTKTGVEPNPNYDGACFSIAPHGTRQVIRSFQTDLLGSGRRFRVFARWAPSYDAPVSNNVFASLRLSCGGEIPVSVLYKARAIAAKDKVVEVCKKYGVEPEDIMREIVE